MLQIDIVNSGMFIRSKGFVLFTRMKSQCTDAWLVERKKYVLNEFKTDAYIAFFLRTARYLFTFVCILHLPVQWDRALKEAVFSPKVFAAHCPLVWLTRVELVFPDLLGRLLGVGGDSPVIRQLQHPATVDDAVTGL